MRWDEIKAHEGQIRFWIYALVLFLPALVVVVAYQLAGREIPSPMPDWLQHVVTGLVALELIALVYGTFR